MQIYLVGGAVRDEILGLPVKDRDWLVVGATPEDLIARGFQQVGKDFPVFLHPESKEEYALARTERKSGTGYHGFICDFSPTVTLDEDLSRRDLTINAIAKDENGTIFDPFGGVNDLKNKLLRHVSPAFIEDPLRVLRVLRFYARFAAFGFSIAPETWNLCEKIVLSGELKNLTRERVLLECVKSLQTSAPEKFFRGLWQLNTLEILGFSCTESELLTLNNELKSCLPLTENSELRLAMWLRLATSTQRDGFCKKMPLSADAKYWIQLVANYGEKIRAWKNCDAEMRWEILKAAKSLRERGNIAALINVMNIAAEFRDQIFDVQQKLIQLDTQKIIANSKTPAEIGANVKKAQLDLLAKF